MITIPQQLNGWRFIKLKHRDKTPLELKWTTTATYGYSDSGILAHIGAGGNYGVLGSEDHVIVDADTPEVQRAMEEHLPLTFTVRTPGHKGRHYYFLCKLEKPIRLRDKNKAIVGDIQGIGKQVVGPSCVHPNGKTYEIVNDRPPNWIVPDDLKRALKEFIIREPPVEKFAVGERKVFQDEGIGASVKITDVHPIEGMRRRGDEYEGPHPIHGSTGAGHNFSINPSKNVWVCRRHDTGGGPLSLLAVKEGIIKCEDAVKGVLRGAGFKQVLKLAREKGFIAGEDKGKITDKFITDTIMAKHLFHCDKTDINQTLYVFTGDHWGNSEAESLILNELSEIFKDTERRTGMLKERATDFIKGQAMNLKLTPKPPELIPFKNGLYDLTKGKLKPHDKQYFYTNVVPHDYTPKARCPKFMKWLREVIKLEDMEFLQEWVGYNFYASYPEPGFLVLIGTGQNGKSCFSRVFKQLIGEKNVTEISLADLTYDDFAPAQLEHKLANISDDIGSATITNTGRLKKVSAGSGITVARKFQQEHDITPCAKPTYSCNEPPKIQDSSEAIKLRLKVVEFPYVFVKKPVEGQKQARDRREVDKELGEEIPGIINWALEGLKRLRKHKFTFTASKSTEETWKFYQRNSNPVVCFIEEGLEFIDDNQEKIYKEPMWKAFQAWALKTKIKRKVSRDKFFKAMKAQEVTPSRPREYEREQVYIGVKLVQTSKGEDYPTPVQEKITNDRKEIIKSGERGVKKRLGHLDTPKAAKKRLKQRGSG